MHAIRSMSLRNVLGSSLETSIGFKNMLLACGGVLILAICPLATAQSLVWAPAGPGPNTRGQVENIKDGEVIGAIKAVALHPSDPQVAYVGAVNGGIWKTSNAMAPKPAWEHLIDDKESLSIGAIEFDPTDPRHLTLVAGTGRFSSLAQFGGARIGLLRTSDGGTSWSILDGGGVLRGLNVSGVSPRGGVIVVSVNDTDTCDGGGSCDGVGIWRLDAVTGKWDQMSGKSGTGLPSGASSSLVGDPNDRERLYTNAGTAGIYCSTNTGQTWTKVSSAEMDGLIAQADNVKIGAGRSNNVYVAIDVPVDEKREVSRLAGVFRSVNSGTSWRKMDLPMTREGGIHPGGQGGIHLSIAADPSSASIVYIGGDAQPGNFPGPPNSIGASDYSGRLFRGDASKAMGKQWVHLTHSNKLGAPGGGTVGGSAPHADSRGMAVAANGVLVEVDDGGIYKRTSPLTNAGDWFSMNGNMQVTEFHSVAWDSNSHVVVGGAQDTGTPEQESRSSQLWRSISKGDGGVVAVDTTSAAGRSIRYSSFYDFFQFRRQVYDASNTFQSEIEPPLKLLGGGSPMGTDQFYTPIKLNTVAPSRLIIGASNSVYESLDQGDTIREIGPRIVANGTGANGIAYGAKGNPDILYVGAGDRVYVRRGPDPDALKASSTYGGGSVLGIALDPNQGETAFVVSPDKVTQTTNAGSNWNEITGNLLSLAPGSLRSIAYGTSNPKGVVIVGSDNGVFTAQGPGFSAWGRFGTGLPNAPVYHVEYSESDAVLVAGTLGRGAWVLTLSQTPPVSRGYTKREQPNVNSEFRSVLKPAKSVFQDAPSKGDSVTPPSDDAGTQAPFQLSPGVIIDPARSRLYAMGADGGISAVDLVRGKRIWATMAAAKPIGFAADKLIGQAETPAAGHDLQVVALDPLTGKKIVANSMALPSHVQPSINRTLKGDFFASATPSEEDTVVTWEFDSRSPRTLPPGTRSELPGAVGGEPRNAPREIDSGAFRMNLKTGAVSSAETDQGRSGQLNLEGLNDSKDRFSSADGRNIMVSKQTGDNADLDKYTLTVLDRKANTRLGEFKSQVSLVPYFVDDSRVIYESSPYVQRTGKGLVQEPPRIRAVDLKSGKEVWSFELRDTRYRGSFPP